MNSEKKTILIIDDESIIAMSQEKALQEYGYNTLIALTHEEAVEIVKSNTGIDLILMDLDLGENEYGTDTAKEILKLKDIPIIFFSNHTEQEIVQRTEAITSYGYVVKNSGITVLDASIKMAFRLHEAKVKIEKQAEELEAANEELNQAIEELEATNEQIMLTQRELLERDTKLTISETRYRTLFEQFNYGVFIHDLQGRMIDVNSNLTHMMEYTKEEICSLTADVFHANKEELKKFQTTFEELLKTGSANIQTVFKTKTGKEIPVKIAAQVTELENSKYVYGIVSDISDKKKTEQALYDSETMLRAILDASPIGIGLVKDRTLDWGNYTIYNSLGYKYGELLGKSARLLYPSDEEFERVGKEIYSALEKNDIGKVETKFIKKDGTLLDFNLMVKHVDPASPERGQIVIMIDITKEKIIREKLSESENLFKSLYENTPGGTMIIDQEYVIVDVNQRTCEITGYAKDELIGKLCDILCPKGSLSKECPIWEFNQEGFHEMDTLIKCKDGSLTPILKNAKRVIVDGKFYIMENFQDLTTLKNIERALRENESLARSLIDIPTDFMALIDTEGKIIETNKTLQEYLQVPRDDIIGLSIWQIIQPDNIENNKKLLSQILKTGKDVRYEVERNKQWFDVIIYPIRSIDDNFDKIAIIARDISSNKSVEEALYQSQRKMRNIVEHSSNLFYSHTPDHQITYLSPQTRQFFDCEPEEAMVKWTEFATDNPMNEVGFNLTMKAIETGIPQQPYELELIGAKGRKIWVEVHETPIVKNGKTEMLVGALIDISERKLREKSLEEKNKILNEIRENLANTNAKLQSMINNTNDFIMIANEKGFPIMFNDNYKHLLEHILQQPIKPGIKPHTLLNDPEQDTFWDALHSRVLQGESFIQEFQYPVDGDIKYFEFSYFPVIENNNIIGFVEHSKDITETKLMEQSLQEAVDEKSRLLNELQHRVKNSFSIIQSLVSLEVDNSVNDEIKEALSKINNRIISMNELYTLLYQTKSVKNVNLNDYFNSIIQSFIGSSTDITKNIELIVDLTDIEIEIKCATIFGLILTELITNAYKHAFHGLNKGYIKINLSHTNSSILLEVIDNGVGLPKNLKIEEKGKMGLELVQVMSKQLSADFTILQEEETIFRVTVPFNCCEE